MELATLLLGLFYHHKGLQPPCADICAKIGIKAMDDTGAVMTPFGDVVAVILVVNSYVVGFLC